MKARIRGEIVTCWVRCWVRCLTNTSLSEHPANKGVLDKKVRWWGLFLLPQISDCSTHRGVCERWIVFYCLYICPIVKSSNCEIASGPIVKSWNREIVKSCNRPIVQLISFFDCGVEIFCSAGEVEQFLQESDTGVCYCLWSGDGECCYFRWQETMTGEQANYLLLCI